MGGGHAHPGAGRRLGPGDGAAAPRHPLQPVAWRATTSDAVYTQPNIPVPHTAGQGDAWTGSYGQLRADVRINANVTAAIEAVRFEAGETLRRAGGHDGSYLGLELKSSW